MKKILTLLLTVSLGLGLASCGGAGAPSTTSPTSMAASEASSPVAADIAQSSAPATTASASSTPSSASLADPSASAAPGASVAPGAQGAKDNTGLTAPKGYALSTEPTDYVVIQTGTGADILVQLHPEAAPKTVANFQHLVSTHFYDGLTFHRVIPDFMIQGGDPTGTGMGGADATIPGEFKSNGVDNKLLHHRGTLSMARSQDPNSASSQFFITVADTPFLDGDYAAFGVVLSGMDEVDRISKVQTDQRDKPLKPEIIKTMFFVKPE